MKREVADRVRCAAEYVIKTGATVRACAEKFVASKTTIHKDLRARLPELDRSLAAAVGRVLDRNRAERHLRGGEATKRKFRRERENRSAGED